MALRETENNAYPKFWVTNKEHYGMYGIFCSGQFCSWLKPRAVHVVRARARSTRLLNSLRSGPSMNFNILKMDS